MILYREHISKISITFLIFCLFLMDTYAQESTTNEIFGEISDQATGKPIENVNVYISNSLYGTSSDKEGKYRLANLPAGEYTLIISHVGYYLEQERIIVESHLKLNYDFSLIEKMYELPQLSVEAEEDDNWQDMFNIFFDNLIGQTENSEETEITNPYEINFYYDEENILIAESDVPINIVNNALGYRIKYFLDAFMYYRGNTKYSGMPVFEEMEPRDSLEKQYWDDNRLRAYCGSLRHFINTICINKQITDGNLDDPEMVYNFDPDSGNDVYLTYPDSMYIIKNGFKILHLTSLEYQSTKSPFITLVNTNRFLSPGLIDSEYKLQFPKYLQVVYDREKEEGEFLSYINERHRPPRKQVSAITLHAPSVTVDSRGRYYDEFLIQTFGYWSYERLADMLPYEYEVSDSILISYDIY